MYFDFLNSLGWDRISDLYYQTAVSGRGAMSNEKPDFWGLMKRGMGEQRTPQGTAENTAASQEMAGNTTASGNEPLSGYQKIMAHSAAKRMRALQNKNAGSYGSKVSSSWLQAYQNSLYWGGRKFF